MPKSLDEALQEDEKKSSAAYRDIRGNLQLSPSRVHFMGRGVLTGKRQKASCNFFT